MTAKALFVRLEAKPGKENEVAKFLRDAQGLVQQEPATTAWFGIKLGPTSFAIFDAFPDDAGRDAHLSGKVAKALMEKAPELLAQPPQIEKADVLADRLPGRIVARDLEHHHPRRLCSLQPPIDNPHFAIICTGA